MNVHVNLTTCAILITAGGTGGHVIPAHVLFQELQMRGQIIHFVTDLRGQAFIDAKIVTNITVIPLPRYQGGGLQKLKFLAALLPSIYQCWRLIRRHRIATVIGFGGYITVPALIAAVMAGCKIILHEQNTVLGRVNRVFGLVAHKIALSTPYLVKCPKYLQQKCVTIGLPVRPEIEQLRHILMPTYPSNNEQHLHILIIGGSQAAAYFSQILPQALELMVKGLRDRLYIHQQCRLEDLIHLRALYQQLNIKAELTTFFDNMPTELLWADLVIARAGASSIAELSSVGKAVLFIPYPHAMDDHQTSNAQMAVQYGSGWWQHQSNCNPATLSRFFKYIINNPQVLTFAAETMRRYTLTQATSKLIHILK